VDYASVKALHIAAVVTSYTLFVVRGVWMVRDSKLLQARAVRVLPHVVDTVLLASAVVLAVTLRQYPFEADWLTAKVLGLVVYIALGTIALNRGKSKGLRVAAWTAAQLVFLYIVAVAITKNPLPV
jgi:uncharacterized membrane protein SirB2